MSEIVDHALAYARAGLEGFPLVPRGKRPLTRNGLLDATTSPSVILSWFEQWPEANWALRVPVGMLVLDVDARSGGTLDSLGVLPETWTAQTGSGPGSYHLWFQWRGQSRGKLAGVPGVDLKSHSGYVAAPPSVHPSGGRYQWLNKAPIAKLPAHLHEAVMPPIPVARNHFRHGGGSGAGLVSYVAKAAPGNRNSMLFWAASRAWSEGGDPKLLAEIAAAAESAGLSVREIEQTMNSAQRRATA